MYERGIFMKNVKRSISLFFALVTMSIVFCFGAISTNAATTQNAVTASVSTVSESNIVAAASLNIPIVLPKAALENSTADDTYKDVVSFFVTWIKRAGFLVAFIGAVMFGLAIKNNDADQKQTGLLTMIAGFVVGAICIGVDLFNLFD